MINHMEKEHAIMQINRILKGFKGIKFIRVIGKMEKDMERVKFLMPMDQLIKEILKMIENLEQENITKLINCFIKEISIFNAL